MADLDGLSKACELVELIVTAHPCARLVDLPCAQFGGMFGSGIKAAHEALRMYDSYEIVEGEVVGLKQKVKA